MFPHYWLATVFVLQAVLVSLPGFSLTSRPLKSLLYTRFFCSCEQLHPLQPAIILPFPPTHVSYAFSTDMVDEFCLVQPFYHLQIEAWRTVPAGCNTLHSAVLLLSSKIQDPKKFLQTFTLHFHFVFHLWLFFVCVCVFVYLVPLCPWMDRRILPICWKRMFNLPK